MKETKKRAKPAVKKKPSPRQDLARRGEQRAADFLQSLGYKIIARNWRSPDTQNEIDLIVEDGDCLVFVEVKAARTVRFGDPITWITPRKQAAIIKAAQSYLANWHPSHGSFRFDAITIGAPNKGKDTPLVHTVAAFTLT